MPDDVSIRPARDRSDADACVELQRLVWGLEDLEITPAIQLLATSHAGGLLQVAQRGDGRIVGFAYAFPGLRGGERHFHSDMVAVLPEHRGRGLGARLKYAQREAALAAGITLITWSFDPLQAANAQLNLRRLGAYAREFVPDMYGVTSSGLHHGLPTHRLLVRWELASPRVTRQAERTGALPGRSVRAPAGPRINEASWETGLPVSSEPALELEAPRLLLEIPPDFSGLSRSAPRLAVDWHGKVTRALGHYLGRGYAASDLVPAEDAGRRRPLYLLERLDPR